MTIRIHEADGTPYEHIIEIKEATTKFDIPYNTKYKRLKRSRRQKERSALAAGIEFPAEGNDDVLIYCLGDILQSDEEVKEWRLTDWSKDDEDKMNQESYEWIRMDADFEWICKMHMNMPGYMYLSQLQQDRDVVAQLEVSGRISFCYPYVYSWSTVDSVYSLATGASPNLQHPSANFGGSTVLSRYSYSCSSGFDKKC